MSNDSTILTPKTLLKLTGSEGIEAARKLYDIRKEDHQLDIYTIYQMRNDLTSLLAFYSAKLDETNPASFPFLMDDEKIRLKNQLTFTYYLLYAKCQLDMTEKRGSTLSSLNKARARCEQLIDKLTISRLEISPESQLQEESVNSEKHIKYCGLTIIAREAVKSVIALISNKIGEFAHDITGSIKGVMGDVNGVRLYWVWSGGLLSTVLSLIPDTFFHVNQAQKGVAAPSPITGCMSWMLYYARFGINLGLLLKHTIAGPWMTDEESSIPTWERFKTQWQLRKFTLLNDSIWATLNMSCFFWLTGSGIAGYAGNILTAGLLLMDLVLSIWKFEEARTQHNNELQQLEDAQQSIEKEINEQNEYLELCYLQAVSDATNNLINQTKNRIQTLEAKRKSNEDLQINMISTWRHSRNQMVNDIIYSAALLAGFGLMCCFFCPPALIAASTATILGLVGATFCFVLNIVSASIAGGLDIHRSKQSKQQAKATINELINEFKECDDENRKKILYLDIRAEIATSLYQQKMMRIQAIKLVRTILVDAMIPVVIFATLVFMPLGIGLGVMAAAFALAAFSKMLINQFEPKADELPEFNEKGFKCFCINPNTAIINYEKNNNLFLTHTAPVSVENDYKPIPLNNSDDGNLDKGSLDDGDPFFVELT